MKHYSVLGLLLVGLLFVPTSQAVADPVGGLRVVVTEAPAAPGPQIVELRFIVSPNDPDQDVGSFDYQVNVEAGSGWVNLGATTLQDDFVAGDGLQTFIIKFNGSPFTGMFNITADDTSGPIDSCIVTVDLSVKGDYDACGDLDTTFEELFCVPRSPDNSAGYNVKKRVTVESTSHLLEGGSGAPGYGGINLGGDTQAMQAHFSIKASVDGLRSDARLLFGTVDSPVSTEQAGNFVNTGAWEGGVSVRMLEIDNDWKVWIYEHTPTGRVTRFTDTFSAGLSTNTETAGFFTVDPYAGIVRLELGDESGAVALSAMTSLGSSPFRSWWVSTPNFDDIFSWQESKTRFGRSGTFGCLNTLPAGQGGGLIEPGAAGDSLDGFGGQGGVGGNPMFPGVDVEAQADALEMDVEIFAWLLAAAAIVGLSLLGYSFARLPGAGIGVLLGTALATAFNLLALWIVVILFLAAVAIIALGRRA